MPEVVVTQKFLNRFCRYSATDHTKFDQSLKHCPLGAVCRNCMPLNDTADTCWAVKSPILYKVKSWGKIETAHKSEQVRVSARARKEISSAFITPWCSRPLSSISLL